ncbi:Structural maintenance of chromosomes protein 2 [Apophysomyces ossiformis]|uniref:Structural maintenance of chromosomes protein n=1 Tax=Apophysomyces ossiformis TaxID=679940 RepID=A0A8H7BGQ8_9FUNG|nr:Structural maintenance of chromosomes protein 2 [Apophysomyces ossiformis]
MYLDELIIEGFKSYVSRTHITGWDPEFNAITGLNGSGKSNVLDAICFVLGITNLSQIRASNLQDLIYKRGQAGVTKASVTIVFNNEARDRSPVGFEEYRQITVLLGGSGIKTKYIVNGHNAQQQTVQNLFQSVQLNINNPHFLIMQGRITKVLNMKPMEILSMVEEAAGTKMFEDRKNKAFITMAKKERKVEEINTILQEEIIPRLDQLRAEKRVYLDYQKIESEVERLNRLMVAFEYNRHEEKINRSGADNNARQTRIGELRETVDVLKSQLFNIEEEKAAKRQESAGSAKFKELQQSLKDYTTQLVRLKTKHDLQDASIADEQKTLSALASSKGEMEKALLEKKDAYSRIHKEYETFKAKYDEKKNEMQKTSELLQTLTTGVSVNEGQENGYMEQIQASKNIASESATAEEQAKLKIVHLRKELQEKEPQAAKAELQNEDLKQEIAIKKKELVELEKQLGILNWNPERENDLLYRKTKEQEKIAELRERQENLSRQLSNLDFAYSNPTPNFDRSKVKGLVAELITLDRENYDASTALEICAGGRLYNVVVEDEVVGAQLLDRGRLRKRWTLIPLSKIQGFQASAEKIATAQRIGPGKVDLALRLVGYDDEVHEAMEWIFGNTLICEDAETAKRVTFHKDIRMKSVTLEGDVYDPFGTLSGGSKPNSAGVLVKIQEFNEIREEIRQHMERLEALEAEIQIAQRTIAQYRHCKQRLDLQSHEVVLLEDRLSKSTHAQLMERVNAVKRQIIHHEEAIVEAQKTRQQALLDCKRLEKEMQEFSSNKDSKLNEMTKRVEYLKAQLVKSVQRVQDMERAVQTLELEIEQLESDIRTCEEDMKKVRQTIDQYKQASCELAKEIEQTKNKTKEVRDALEHETQIINAHNEEIQRLEELHKEKSAEIVEHDLEIQKITHDMERHQKEYQAAQQKLNELESEYDWIVDQKQFFGQANTPYDYRGINISDTKKTLQQLAIEHDAMRKKINVRVMNMIDNVEKKEASLKQMLATVQKDKQKIEDTIKSLDNYKLEALEKTWTKVNTDFAGIFGDLLAGNTCKLQAPEGKTISEGLEVKVCLGGVWKQSLTELSGGQRSLIALSLILSLLQFKPAPMYILDEVDAALDLSHTQNIGQLLRTRFKGSQFVVVSLKDGMFNNANVLFKTRFKDGTSVVERTTSRSEKRNADGSAQDMASSSSRKRGRDQQNRHVS